MIRMSTFAAYTAAVNTLSASQRRLLEIQNDVATGKRINAPVDDPVGAGTAALLRSEMAQTRQFTQNQALSKSLLDLNETAITEFIGAVQDVQDRLAQSGNGVMSDGDRRTLGDDLQGILERMVGIANGSDGNGGYLFAGTRDGTLPFAMSASGVTYAGDSTGRSIEISNGRFQHVKLPGDALFMRMRPGNGTFVTGSGASNAGTGVIDAGTVVDPGAVTGHAYAVSFAGAAGSLSYSVTDTTTGATVVPATAYTSPAVLRFDGMQMSVSGTPAAGDGFTVTPAANQSVFDSLAQAVALLRGSTSTEAARARFQSGLMSLNASMSGALAHLNERRAAVGTQRAELDAYELINDDRLLDLKTRVSAIEDLDYVEGASELAQRQATFEAGLQSYSTISKLSLFNFI